MSIPAHASFAVVGAGPAGLTAAFELARRGLHPFVFEASHELGGLARTYRWNGNRIDLGGHRFFTKNEEVRALWAAMMDEPMLEVRRLSRIYHRGRFFHYPLRLANTVANLGLVESTLLVGSYLRAQIRPARPEVSFADWVRNRFGDRLYQRFFKTYTEKVWGIPCTEIRADWAAQRIHGLSFVTAALNALRNGGGVKSLIETFAYPRLGPGQLWESAARKIIEMGGAVVPGARVVRLRHESGRVTALELAANGTSMTVRVDHLVSTMPLADLARQLDPAPPPQVIAAAAGLRHRDFLIVALACRNPAVFSDNWIYIHSPEVRVGRIQNFRNWSTDLVAPGNGTTLGLEYFCSRGDDLWTRTDGDLVTLAIQELNSLGLVAATDIAGGMVMRQPLAYPVYDAEYRERVDTLRNYLATTFVNVETAGRNGLHRYNNQDHSMLAGLHAARRLLGRTDCDPWDVNTERAYCEEDVLSSAGEHLGTDILAADRVSPHEVH
jgi:protoporphyrinogen oxidase